MKSITERVLAKGMPQFLHPDEGILTFASAQDPMEDVGLYAVGV